MAIPHKRNLMDFAYSQERPHLAVHCGLPLCREVSWGGYHGDQEPTILAISCVRDAEHPCGRSWLHNLT